MIETKIKGIDKKSRELEYNSNAHKTLVVPGTEVFLKDSEVRSRTFTPKEYLMACTAERLLHSSLWRHDTFTTEDVRLETRGLLYLSDGAYHRTAAGEKWLKDNARELLEFPCLLYWNYKEVLIKEFVTLEILPQLLCCEDDNIRKLARERFEELTKEVKQDV